MRLALQTGKTATKTTNPRQAAMAEQGGQPERRIGGILKSKVLGRRRVTLGVSRDDNRKTFLKGTANVCRNYGL